MSRELSKLSERHKRPTLRKDVAITRKTSILNNIDQIRLVESKID